MVPQVILRLGGDPGVSPACAAGASVASAADAGGAVLVGLSPAARLLQAASVRPMAHGGDYVKNAERAADGGHEHGRPFPDFLAAFGVTVMRYCALSREFAADSSRRRPPKGPTRRWSAMGRPDVLAHRR